MCTELVIPIVLQITGLAPPANYTDVLSTLAYEHMDSQPGNPTIDTRYAPNPFCTFHDNGNHNILAVRYFPYVDIC